MAPVTARTNKDNPKIDFAGVDAGAKMFVGLQGWAVSTKASAVPHIKTITGDILTSRLLERDRKQTPYRLVFRFDACKALAKLRLNWNNGLSYQLQRNRTRESVYFNNAEDLVSIDRHVASHHAQPNLDEH
jgi:hypothetical protein